LHTDGLQVVRLAFAREPRRAQDRQLGGLEQRFELEELRDHRRLAVRARAVLDLDARLAQLVAREVERSLCHAESARGDGRAASC
jgi:hypothetical protein